MPEGPDVKIIAEYLLEHYLGEEVTFVRNEMTHESMQLLLGYYLVDVSSHGKELHFRWVKGDAVLHTRIHLMTCGRLYDSYVQDKGHYFTLTFSNGANLTMYDHMGIAKCEVSKDPFEKKGKCVMSTVSVEDVKDAVQRKANVVTCLLDQNHLCGIGTLLVNEILFAARICPSRKGNTLTEDEIGTLTSSINEISSTVYACGGFPHSPPTYPDGRKSMYSHSHLKEEGVRKVKVGSRLYHTLVPLLQAE